MHKQRSNIHAESRYSYFMLKSEKLPQAFMQFGWMENEFRNLTAKVWASLDNPIKSYAFSKFWLFLYVGLWGDTLLQYVMSQQHKCRMELHVHKFHKIVLFMKIYQDFALINSYNFSPCWIEHLFLIIITPRSSNLVENCLFLWVISYGLSFSGFAINLSLIVPRNSGNRANPEMTVHKKLLIK